MRKYEKECMFMHIKKEKRNGEKVGEKQCENFFSAYVSKGGSL
jgi:hypothetical protein